MTLVSFVFSAWAESRSLNQENAALAETMAQMSKEVLGEETDDAERVMDEFVGRLREQLDAGGIGDSLQLEDDAGHVGRVRHRLRQPEEVRDPDRLLVAPGPARPGQPVAEVRHRFEQPRPCVHVERVPAVRGADCG